MKDWNKGESSHVEGSAGQRSIHGKQYEQPALSLRLRVLEKGDLRCQLLRVGVWVLRVCLVCWRTQVPLRKKTKQKKRNGPVNISYTETGMGSDFPKNTQQVNNKVGMEPGPRWKLRWCQMNLLRYLSMRGTHHRAEVLIYSFTEPYTLLIKQTFARLVRRSSMQRS